MAGQELSGALLPDVRNYLDITWPDPDGDKKLEGIILRGAAYVQRLTCRQLTFEEGTAERGLLFDYCRYAMAGAPEDFSENYRAELLTFRTDEEVLEHAKSSQDDTGV